MFKALITGDLHYQGMNPRSRLDNYPEAIIAKIYEVYDLARKHGVDSQSRWFSPWSHVVSQVHTQPAHSLSLNDVCDDLRNHRR